MPWVVEGPLERAWQFPLEQLAAGLQGPLVADYRRRSPK